VYDVRLTDEALADVRALPKNVKNFLKKEISKKLARDPYGRSKELCDPLKGWRSFICGKYRVVFRVYDDLRVIAIAGIGERLPQSQRDVYRKLETLAAEGRLAQKVLRALRGFSPSPKSRDNEVS
jgi:mRNA-degrading endonuclease RelE of RelBE toxin-antitoxin system